jgi:hypothetical protein
LLVKVVAPAGGSVTKACETVRASSPDLSRDCVIRALSSRKLAMNSASQGSRVPGRGAAPGRQREPEPQLQRRWVMETKIDESATGFIAFAISFRISHRRQGSHSTCFSWSETNLCCFIPAFGGCSRSFPHFEGWRDDRIGSREARPLSGHTSYSSRLGCRRVVRGDNRHASVRRLVQPTWRGTGIDGARYRRPRDRR